MDKVWIEVYYTLPDGYDYPTIERYMVDNVHSVEDIKNRIARVWHVKSEDLELTEDGNGNLTGYHFTAKTVCLDDVWYHNILVEICVLTRPVTIERIERVVRLNLITGETIEDKPSTTKTYRDYTPLK